MKLINALSALWMLLMVASCSMEDDTLLNPDGNTMTGVPEVYASVEVSLHTDQDGVSTKGTSSVNEGGTSNPTDEEGKLMDCYIAVFDAGGVFLGSNFYNKLDANGELELTKRIIFKIPANKDARGDLKFVAVANIGTASAMIGLDYDRLMESTFGVGPTSMPKVGEIVIEKDADGNYPASETSSYYVTISSNAADLDKDSSPIEIHLKQRTAAILLNEFTMKNGDRIITTKVTKVRLQNIVQRTKVAWGNGVLEDYEMAYQEYLDKLKGDRFYSYQNAGGTKTSMKVWYDYTIGETTVPGVFECTVKSPLGNGFVEQVWAGYLYKLNVTINKSLNNVEASWKVEGWRFDRFSDIEMK